MPQTTIGGFIAGGLAACGAVTVTNPFEVVKTRLQLQGELASKAHVKKVYTGIFQALHLIYKTEGVRGTQKGLGCAYIYQILLNGCRLGFYEPIRSSTTLLLTGDSKHQVPYINVFAGATSGIMGGIAGSPFFLFKTRLQSYSPAFPVGTQHPYKNFVEAGRTIYSAEGFKGLYRGVTSAVVRTGAGSSVQLPTYFFAKRQIEKYDLMEEGPLKHIAASACSGVAVCIVMHPPDTVMSRMYNQNGNLYSSLADCFVKTIKTEGVFALYKGVTAHLARILPHTILTLSLAEQTNKFIESIERRVL
ncbi:Mitochondrial oxaloacetate carrier protein [Orbilia javanica]|uniref:Mitochondrial oxaloacetate carrier protein n=1 Tax=Orbilia javanica TaxID=47235 RepID=A0AAN8RMT4_9PEZI